ncbi:MAG: PQQ-binding-like beta-propeller repeat protein [Kiritimatiellae bacterium]|nr:PQQ-binding-like beta-propeller repeat protein [Kiritimatiellia bacterium]
MNKLTILILTTVMASTIAQATQTTGWRGDGSGKFLNVQPPITWSTTENVVWKTKLPDWSNANPVLVNDLIFICVEPSTIMCLSATDGKIKWQHANMYTNIVPPSQVQEYIDGLKKHDEIGKEMAPYYKEVRTLKKSLKNDPDNADLKKNLEAKNRTLQSIIKKQQPFEKYSIPKCHAATGYSTPTPVTDGTSVFVLFGNGVAARYDFNGKRYWARDIGRPSHSWGHSASPLLVDNTLIIHMGHQIMGLDPKTGTTKWETADKSKWGTPAAAKLGNDSVVITTYGAIIRVSDGKKVGNKVGSMPYTSPITENGVIYVVDQNGAQASKLPITMSDTIEPEILWTMKPKKSRYYASPVCHEGILYAIHQQGWLSAIDIKTGAIIYEEKLNLGAIVYPSVTLAGDKLYVSGEKGRTIVFATGRTFKELAKNNLEPFRANPVFSGKRMYVRGKNSLWCIGK